LSFASRVENQFNHLSDQVFVVGCFFCTKVSGDELMAYVFVLLGQLFRELFA
jgi:hypothetical protein